MKEIYMRYRNIIIMVINVMIIALGILGKDPKFIVIGILLIALSFYTTYLEKKVEEQKAREKAERKAKKAVDKYSNNTKKKKKKSKKRR